MNSPVNRADSHQNIFLVVERVFPARREKVYHAWIDPNLMEKWFRPANMQLVGIDANVVVGGRYRIGMRDTDGTIIYVGGKYVEILPPERLVFTWAWETDPPGMDSQVTVEFFEQGEVTRVVLRHEQFADTQSRDQHRRGWEEILGLLEQSLSSGEF